MRIHFRLVFLSVFLLFWVVSNSQFLKENEVVVIKGEKFILHQVRTGETIFSITRNYKTDSLTLAVHNPEISGGLKIGDVLKIPFRSDINQDPVPVFKKGDPNRFDIHKIKSRKETPYFIAKSYGITVEELYAYNPEVNRFRRGTKLRIPRWDAPANEIKAEKRHDSETEDTKNKLFVHEVSKGETLYSISKKYNVTESEILFYNPDARNLKAGSTIYLPQKTVIREVSPEVVPEPAESVGKYFEHVIESGETLWGITHRFGISEDELKKLNPALESGFPAGLTIKIPVQEQTESDVKPVNNEAFISHYVEKGETLFGLSSKYELPITEIKKFNPVLNNRNLVHGETILIPHKPDKEVLQFMGTTPADSVRLTEEFFRVEIVTDIPESCKPGNFSFGINSTYDVALFLPLFLEANDTIFQPGEIIAVNDSLLVNNNDSITEITPGKTTAYDFYGRSEQYLQFYEGILLAADSISKSGTNIRLHVFDTQNNADSIRNYLYTDNFQEYDLIVGPVNERIQGEVAQIAAKNRIPFVSPISPVSKEITTNSSYFQVNPNRNVLARKTAEMVAEEYYNCNFVVCQTGNHQGTYEEMLLKQIKEKIFNSGALSDLNGVSYRVYDYAGEGPFGLRGILSRTKENVLFIPSSNEGDLSIAISNIFNLSDEYSITLIAPDYRFQQFYKSINVEHFHKLKLQYVDPFWVDYSRPETIKFIEKFKHMFYTEPNNFGIQGYDVGMYFFSALKNFGKNFEDCLPYNPVRLIQGNYNFRKVSRFGGFMNTGVSVISYQPDYQVVRKRVNDSPVVIAEK